MHLSSRALGDQATGAVDASWVKLDELQILKWQASPGSHCTAISGAGVRRCSGKVSTPIALLTLPGNDQRANPGSEDGVVCPESVNGSIFHAQCNYTVTLAVMPACDEQTRRAVYMMRSNTKYSMKKMVSWARACRRFQQNIKMPPGHTECATLHDPSCRQQQRIGKPVRLHQIEWNTEANETFSEI